MSIIQHVFSNLSNFIHGSALVAVPVTFAFVLNSDKLPKWFIWVACAIGALAVSELVGNLERTIMVTLNAAILVQNNPILVIPITIGVVLWMYMVYMKRPVTIIHQSPEVDMYKNAREPVPDPTPAPVQPKETKVDWMKRLESMRALPVAPILIQPPKPKCSSVSSWKLDVVALLALATTAFVVYTIW
jgi:hypothetical protein